MKFISYTNKYGDLIIINRDQIIKCYITTETISIYLNDSADCIIQAKNDSDLFASFYLFLTEKLEDDYRVHNSDLDKEK